MGGAGGGMICLCVCVCRWVDGDSERAYLGCVLVIEMFWVWGFDEGKNESKEEMEEKWEKEDKEIKIKRSKKLLIRSM